MSDEKPPLIEARDIKKSFGSIQALRGITFGIKENEVLALVGDNGAGKSTFIKTLVGLETPNAGEYYFRGEPVDISSPRVAQQMGIATVHQDLGLVDELSVAANIFLGRHQYRRIGGVLPVLDWSEMNRQAKQILQDRLDIHLDPETKVEFLSGGERQAVAISRALISDPQLIIMDEPTSALSAAAAQKVEDLVKTLRDQGETILIVDHNLDEVFSLADRLAVIHNGSLVTTVHADDVTQDQLVQMMVGGSVPSSVDIEPTTVV